MTTFEILTIILSGLAFVISLSAFIISVVKTVNERKIYKKQFIVDNLIKLRSNLNAELTALEQLDPEINASLLFARIEKNEDFNYYNEIVKLHNDTTTITSNALILLSSYKATDCNRNMMEVLKNITNDIGKCMQIVIHNKGSREDLIKKFVSYKKTPYTGTYVKCKYDILIELSDTIKHLINDKIANDELNSYFVQFGVKKEDSKN